MTLVMCAKNFFSFVCGFLGSLGSNTVFVLIEMWIIPGVPDSGAVSVFRYPIFALGYRSGEISITNDFSLAALFFLSVLVQLALGYLIMSQRVPLSISLGFGVISGLLICNIPQFSLTAGDVRVGVTSSLALCLALLIIGSLICRWRWGGERGRF